MRDCTVVIPSLRGGPALTALVAQLSADAEVVVADNGMSPAARSAASDAGARVLELGTNVGFATAVNRAAAAAGGRGALVVLNDDISPEPGFLAALVAPLADAEMASGVLLKAEQPALIETAGIVIDRCLGAYDHLQDRPVAALAGAQPPFGPTGGAAAFRREAFERVGGYDAGFFAYFEDVDLAIRLRRSGARCALAADARAVHIGSATLGYGSVEKAVLVGASRGRIVRKYGLLRDPGAAAWVLATEALTSAELLRRHRSLRPVRARVAGFASCRERAPRPPAGVATIALRDGLSRRLRRSRRVTIAA
jgi:N-acetylglucosaminyl-diphospho-decaprenol L-rhamnosyltransferase